MPVLHIRYLPVKGRNNVFPSSEKTVGLQQVVYRRYEISMVVPSVQNAGISGEKSRTAFLLYDEHAKHLSFFEFFFPFRHALQIMLHFLCRHSTERMRLITEGICELFRKTDVFRYVDKLMKCCHVAVHALAVCIGAKLLKKTCAA